MAIDTRRLPDQNLLISTCSGPLTLEELSFYVRSTWLNSDNYGLHELIDLRAATPALLYGDLLKLAQQSAQIVLPDALPTRAALLVETKEQEEVAQFYLTARNIYASTTRDMKLFRDLNEAMNWLVGNHITANKRDQFEEDNAPS